MDYTYINKVHGANGRYAVVNNLPFEGLVEAVAWCELHELDPEQNIRWHGIPEAERKAYAQFLAMAQKPVVREIKDLLERNRKSLKAQIELTKTRLETCHPLERSYFENRLIEEVAAHTENCDCQTVVSGILERLNKISQYKELPYDFTSGR